MAPNVFDYIRNCIHRSREDQQLGDRKTLMTSSDHESSSRITNWKETLSDQSQRSAFSQQYMPSNELSRTYINSPPNRNVRDITYDDQLHATDRPS